LFLSGKRTNQALRRANREAHADIENDGQEVCNSIRDGGRQAEQASEGKDLQVQDAAHILAKVERLSNDIVAILFDPGADECSLLLVQERQSRLGVLRCVFWEVDNGNSTDEANHDGYKSLHDENPSPSCNTRHNTTGCCRVGFGRSVMLAIVWTEITKAVHLPETVRHDSRERRAHASDEIEDRVTLLKLVTGIPARQEICASLLKVVSI
jgi:hypothetical protein